LLARQAEAPLAAAEESQSGLEVRDGKVRPEPIAEKKLRVGGIPEEEIADALLATRADEELGIRQPGKLQLCREALLIDVLWP
jgi:hypothetical protein